jgi:pseudo-rSAM protein
VVSSDEDYRQAEQIVEQYPIEQYQIKPVYTGGNIAFFEENVFLVREDILSTSMSIKDFFFKQNMNTNDFGKINILTNGDVYANLNHPTLGNISTQSIDEIVYKELEEGKSWLRVRDQAPCNNCLYQWLCPSPSDYEVAIDRSNLCHVKQ